MAKVKKESKGYNYNYADLGNVTSYIDEIHGKYYQYTATDELDNKCYVYTHRYADDIIPEDIDVRGVSIVSATLSNGKVNPAQAAGAATTYARRYSLYMAYGVACVDDDAESLTVPPEAVDSIAADFPEPAPKLANRSATRAAIRRYCEQHNLDITDIAERYTITKGMSEDTLKEKLALLKRDYGD